MCIALLPAPESAYDIGETCLRWFEQLVRLACTSAVLVHRISSDTRRPTQFETLVSAMLPLASMPWRSCAWRVEGDGDDGCTSIYEQHLGTAVCIATVRRDVNPALADAICVCAFPYFTLSCLALAYARTQPLVPTAHGFVPLRAGHNSARSLAPVLASIMTDSVFVQAVESVFLKSHDVVLRHVSALASRRLIGT